MNTDTVLVPVMRLLSTFDAKDIVTRASTCARRLTVQGYQRGDKERFDPTYRGSAASVLYIVAKYDESGEEDPLYQPLEDTLTNKKYSDEMKITRINIMKQKGDAQ